MIEITKKILSLLKPDQKKRLFYLFFAMLAGAVLETISVALVVPMIQAVLNPELVSKNRYIRIFIERFFPTQNGSFLSFSILALILIYVLKNLYMFLEQKLCAGFSSDCSMRLKNMLAAFYLRRHYEHYLTTNTNDIYQLILNDTSSVVTIIQNMLMILTESVIAVFLAAAIFVIDPIMTVWAVLTLLVVVILILAVIRPRISRIGNQCIDHNIRRSNWLIQGLRGIKEIKTLHTEDYIISHIAGESKSLRSLECQNAVYSSVPRMFVETVCVCSMLGYLYFLVLSGVDLSLVLPAVSAFAMAAIKLMPAAIRISGAISGKKKKKKSLDRICDALKEGTGEESRIYGRLLCRDEKEEPQDMLYIKDLSYHYPSGKRKILDHADASFPLGKISCIIGESGVGKTTLADLILGLLIPEEGEIYANKSGTASMKIGYIPQSSFMLDDSIKGNIAFGLDKDHIDDKKVMECLQAVGLESFIKNLPEGIETQIGEGGIRVSGGQRQRIGIARALYRDCDLFILDEPTAALDKETEFIVLDTIQSMARDKTFLIIAHNMYTIESCDLVYEVKDGKLELAKEKKW